jgi:hypothetical protein
MIKDALRCLTNKVPPPTQDVGLDRGTVGSCPPRLGFIFQLLRDQVRRSCHLLVRCAKTPKKSQKQNADAGNACEMAEQKIPAGDALGCGCLL